MTRKVVLAVLTLALLLPLSVPAQTGGAAAAQPPAQSAAAPAGPAKVGIINIQQAIVASNEGQRDLQQLQKKFEPTKTKLEGQNKEIESLKSQLTTQGDKLNEDTAAKVRRDLDAKQKAFQRDMEDAQGDFQAQQNEILNRIGQKMIGVLDTYAKGQGYTLILDVSNPQTPVLWAGQQVDITKQIVDAYNAQSGVPAPAAAAGTTAPSATRPAGGAVNRPAGATQNRPAPPKPAPTTTPK